MPEFADLIPSLGSSALVSGDALVLAKGESCSLAPLEAQRVALIHRAFCTMHGAHRDEYRTQLDGSRFSQPETVIAEQLFASCVLFGSGVGAVDGSGSDAASDSNLSSTQHHNGGSNTAPTRNTNFFALHVDERPAVELLAATAACSVVARTLAASSNVAPRRGHGGLSIETSDRTIESVPLIVASQKTAASNAAPNSSALDLHLDGSNSAQVVPCLVFSVSST